MVSPFTPLDPDTRHKNLKYVSEKKLKQLLLDTTRRGLGVTLPFGIGGLTLETQTRSVRDQLNDAAKLFEANRLLTYETNPKVGGWLLVRALGECGTAWPWAGNSDGLRQTAWWVAHSERLRVVAYGHRDHVLGNGKMPPSEEPSPRATWWPSIDGGYRELLASVARVARSDDLDESVEPTSISGSPATFRDFGEHFFNPGVRRADYLVRRGVYELLLRVDGIESGESGQPAVVYGSPLWVAEVGYAVPGTYLVQSYADEPGVSAVATWDGIRWSDLRLQDHRNPYIRHRAPRAPLPQMPFTPPDLNQLLSLTIRKPRGATEPPDEQSVAVGDNSIRRGKWRHRRTQK